LWDIFSGKKIASYERKREAFDLAFAPDGNHFGFANGFGNGVIDILDISARETNRILTPKSADGIFKVAFSPNGKLILGVSINMATIRGQNDINTIDFWDLPTGQIIKTVQYEGPIINIAVSKDSNMFTVVGGNRRTVNLYNMDSGSPFGIFDGDNVAEFTFDSKYILAGSINNTLSLWDINNQRQVQSFVGHSSPVKSIATLPNNKNALSGGEDRIIRLWDINTGVEEKTFIGHIGTINSLTASTNGEYVLSGSSDGTIRLWNVSTGSELAQYYSFSDGEWIVVTPEGYYNSSPSGHKHLNIRVGNNVYGIDQFFDVFYRPDIVMAKLKGEDIKPLITLTIDDAIKNPPPEVDFTSVPSDSTTPKVKVCYQAKNTGGGIGEVRLFHNGKLIQSDGFYKDVAKTAGKIQLASLDSKSIREDMRSIVIKSTTDISPIASKAKGDIIKDCVVVDAVPGENEVSVSAFNKDNTVQSYMKMSSFKANIKAEDSHLYMLIVGTDQYNDRSVNLKYAVKDARDIKDKLLSQSATLYKRENIHAIVLTDKEATKANIQSQISLLAKKIKPTDSFVLFVAGHGVLLQNQYFMLTSDFDGTISDNSMISSNEIVEASKQIKSLSQLFIFDTCHAGGVDYIVSGLYDARMSVLAKKMGLHIYASANDKQAAMDGYKGNGLFTYTLLSGLNNKKEADKNNDGTVSLVELGGYSKQATADISKEIGHSQTPLIINFGKDSPIYKLQ
jgi:hypothetical protein